MKLEQKKKQQMKTNHSIWKQQRYTDGEIHEIHHNKLLR